jgi:predicted HAD superfamily Cof-like phosphohydrolase
MTERRDPQEMLTQWHLSIGDPVPSAPVDRLAGMVLDPQLRLARDELDELAEAVAAGDVAAAAHEMADVIYAVYGYAVRNGIDLTAVLAEVHTANLSKLDGARIIRADGKVLKGPRYRAPDVAAELGRQRDVAS